MNIKDFYKLPEEKQLEIVLKFRELFNKYFVEMGLGKHIVLNKVRREMKISIVVCDHIFRHDLEIKEIYEKRKKHDFRGFLTRASGV